MHGFPIHRNILIKELLAIHRNIFGKALLVTIQRIHEVDGNAKDAVAITQSIDFRRKFVNHS